MRTNTYKTLLGIVLTAILTTAVAFSAKRDPFMQADLEHPFRRVWSPRLEVTPFDCGRFVVLPAFEPECSVSIYSSRDSRGAIRYRITYILMKQNLWQITDGLRDLRKATAVGTIRKDADIPESTAELLRRVWSRTLTGNHPRSSVAPRENYILIDSPTFEWSLQRPHASPLRVQANLYISASPRRKLFADLCDITLPKYCKAPTRDRPAILREIERQARKLLNEKT